MISTGTAKTTLEHREAFIQDLAGLEWDAWNSDGWVCDYEAFLLTEEPDSDDDPVYRITVLRTENRAYAITTEDADFHFDLTLDEAKRILGKAWREA